MSPHFVQPYELALTHLVDDDSAHVADRTLQPVLHICVVDGVESDAEYVLFRLNVLHSNVQVLRRLTVCSEIVLLSILELQRYVVLVGDVHSVWFGFDDP